MALGTGGVAHAADPVITVGADGKTAPVFSYADAKRERVWVPNTGVDQNNDGVIDRIAIDIIRPKESGPNLKVPAIIDDSPYYTSVGRGNETQFIHTTADGVLDKFPLFYDNYFVPRGYAVILAHADGTAFSTGCPLHGGPGDVNGFKSVIDWLEGRIPGYTSSTGDTLAVADWANGKNAMIGKSYDGTFANGVAATGVDGLTTIVPISAISDWYDYSRMGGIRENTHYPHSLDNSITATQSLATLGVLPPDHRTSCTTVFNNLDLIDGDATGDINPFWNDRDYAKDVSKVKAAVFESHGINDDNVRPDQMYRWWTGLAANNVPRKLWLSLEGHVDPFDYRRDAFVDTLNRWFDYWLQGVQNGIMDQPRVDIETSADTFTQFADWPLPNTSPTNIYLGGRGAGKSGSLLLSSGGDSDSLAFTDNSLSETNAINTPNGSQANRLSFLTPKLKTDLHLSGQPIIDIQASLSTTQSNLAALLVDYGPGSHVGRGGSDGVTNTTTRTCVGDSTAADSACYLTVTKPVQTVTSWRISKGILDSSNRDSLIDGQASPVVAGQKYEFKFPVLPTEYTIPAGHQLGVILLANYSMGVAGTRGAVVTVDTKASKVILPVTGGSAAATATGAFVADTTAPTLAPIADVTANTTDLTGTNVSFSTAATDTQDAAPTVTCDKTSGSKFPIGATTVTCTATDANGNASAPQSFKVTVFDVTTANGDTTGTVPATLSLTLGTSAAFGFFTPGVTKTYESSMSANVISTAGDALLSVADPSSDNTGHLVNGAFALPQPLQARARNAANTGTPYNNVGSSASPLNLLTYSGPASNDAVTLGFSQLVNSSDPLRTGTYSKTLTFTLSTTTP
ncbi:CocE/NonD family hydrolase [Solirubrobacter ginsenosidimutans]|uniref:CocE/NonD family hydrolase n=1 Tax=Solirubrobacter ginsenosidimutans TaxID=490573 RepID=A0A9X3MP03_9ACTN|nr:CocE/NonD family hydrolase [Solirubrobacter ginsenosidimutans]MDA0159732.1 CocE/NonD family hydrolase [Solirubrobacter ginsenosidimutans]